MAAMSDDADDINLGGGGPGGPSTTTAGTLSFVSEAEMDRQFPDRPRNGRPTLPFHVLLTDLFDPLQENRKRAAVGARGPAAAAAAVRLNRARHGGGGGGGHHRFGHPATTRSPHEQRRAIVERFISRWRSDVGPDIFPALRLVVPDKDRDRAMYGLKEKAIGKILVKITRIDKNSEDGFSLLNWKLPVFGAGGGAAAGAAAAAAGDFAGRCYDVLSKRPIRTEPGDMSITEVNELLDRLADAQKESGQLPIFQEFYTRMSPAEMMWLIRMVLRQMKIGATERTIFDIWHPDAAALYSCTSSLRRVCWQLWDPHVRLEDEATRIGLMQCFQPQLAQFQMHDFDKMVARMQPTEDDREFWIEEKMDGERMQMHMQSDVSIPGGRRFAWWSRKAKEYTYLYGGGLHDDNSAMTRHLQAAFDPRVQNVILDGEMITWNMEEDALVPFGTLKTAALDQQRNPYDTAGHRPVYRIFDILYLNDKPLTNYTLRDRRHALEASVRSIPGRFQIQEFRRASTADEIYAELREVVAHSSEGLVLKNPRSPYRLSQRNDDWMKVKPEYMKEYGESFDCVVVGGYYGSGHRGGKLSSFLCGLLEDPGRDPGSGNPQRTLSFFKVGGGFAADDYAAIRHQTDGKWIKWDARKPPRNWVDLAGRDHGSERPDEWIKPEDSVVIQVKAASVNDSESFRVGRTIRFPRFQKIRSDKSWTEALTLQEFYDLDNSIQRQNRERQFQIDDDRRKRLKGANSQRKPLRVAGGTVDDVDRPYHGATTRVFEGLKFFVMSESLSPERRTKAELEQLIRANGGSLSQTYDVEPKPVCVADKRLVKVAALERRADVSIVRACWIFDCVRQAAAAAKTEDEEQDPGRRNYLLPLEPRHMLFTRTEDAAGIDENVDEYGDGFARDVAAEELRQIFNGMNDLETDGTRGHAFRQQLEEHGRPLGDFRAWLFDGLTLYFDFGSGPDAAAAADKGDDSRTGTSGNRADALADGVHGGRLVGGDRGKEQEEDLELERARVTARFAGAALAEELSDRNITHVIVSRRHLRRDLRPTVAATRRRLPRFVTAAWVHESWKEQTLLDEERFATL